MKAWSRWLLSFLSIAVLFFLWEWAAYEPHRMNVQKKFIRTVVAPAVARGQSFPDGRALENMTLSLRRHLRRHPDDANAAMLLALCLRAKGLDAEAISVYERLQSVQPRGEVYLQLGLLHLQKGREADGMEALQTAVGLDRNAARGISDPRLRWQLIGPIVSQRHERP